MRTQEKAKDLYVVQAESEMLGDFVIKVGKSKNPDKRINGLRTGCPFDLTLLRVFEGMGPLEERVHTMLEQDIAGPERLNGEWFHLAEDQLNALLLALSSVSNGSLKVQDMKAWVRQKISNGTIESWVPSPEQGSLKTIEELSDELDISRRTIYRRIDEGSIEKVETPEGMRYRGSDCEQGAAGLWMRRDELAAELNITVRTVTRMVNRGEVVRRSTKSDGNWYLLLEESNTWRTAEDLADDEGITVRSVYRRLKNGTVESVETPDGTRYRVCEDEEPKPSQDSSGDDAIIRLLEKRFEWCDREIDRQRKEIDELREKVSILSRYGNQ